ncbi:MAG TPA: hypothetical protein VIV60_22665, partial [Polyangiaceae bacterium]
MLVVCRHCRRHFHREEAGCPFCGTASADSSKRLGIGLAVALGVVSSFSCGGSTEDPANPDNTGGASVANGGATSTSSMNTGGMGMVAYGLPPSGGATAHTSSGGATAQGGGQGASTNGGVGGLPSAGGDNGYVGGQSTKPTVGGGPGSGGNSTSSSSAAGGAYAPPAAGGAMVLYGGPP